MIKALQTMKKNQMQEIFSLMENKYKSNKKEVYADLKEMNERFINPINQLYLEEIRSNLSRSDTNRN